MSHFALSAGDDVEGGVEQKDGEQVTIQSPLDRRRISRMWVDHLTEEISPQSKRSSGTSAMGHRVLASMNVDLSQLVFEEESREGAASCSPTVWQDESKACEITSTSSPGKSSTTDTSSSTGTTSNSKRISFRDLSFKRSSSRSPSPVRTRLDTPKVIMISSLLLLLLKENK